MNQEIKIDLLNRYAVEICSYLNKQFKMITASPLTTSIEWVDSGTKVSYFTERKIVDGMVQYVEQFKLSIGTEELNKMVETHKHLTLNECLNKIVTHEYLHVLYGDFSNVKLSNIYNFALGVKKSYIPDSIYFQKSGKSYDKRGFEKVDKRIVNIAADFVINANLDIRKPFLRAEDFNFPDDLNIYEYYYLIYQNRDRDDIKNAINSVNEENISSFCEIEGNSSIPFIESKKIKFANRIDMKYKLKRLNKASEPGNESYLDYLIRKFENPNNKRSKNLRTFINKIRNENLNLKLVNLTKIEDWFKINTRRDYGDGLIIPGKREIHGKDSIKFEVKPVIFVDNSASMYNFLEEVYCFCYMLLEQVNCTIAFYDTKIIDVIDGVGKINLPMFDGEGTDIRSCINEFERNYFPLKNIYILTDGFDYYGSIPDENILIFDSGNSYFKNEI